MSHLPVNFWTPAICLQKLRLRSLIRRSAKKRNHEHLNAGQIQTSKGRGESKKGKPGRRSNIPKELLGRVSKQPAEPDYVEPSISKEAQTGDRCQLWLRVQSLIAKRLTVCSITSEKYQGPHFRQLQSRPPFVWFFGGGAVVQVKQFGSQKPIFFSSVVADVALRLSSNIGSQKSSPSTKRVSHKSCCSRAGEFQVWSMEISFDLALRRPHRTVYLVLNWHGDLDPSLHQDGW